MKYKINCLIDNFIDTEHTEENYGYDPLLLLRKNADSTTRIITKFDIASLYPFMADHSLAISSITSAVLTYFDISNYNHVNSSYTSEQTFTNATIELKLLSQVWDEGIGDTTFDPPISGYSNYINALDSTAWTTSGGAISSVTSTVSAEQVFSNGFDDIELNILTHLNYLYDFYSASALDLNKGFLIKLSDAIESGTASYENKRVISKDSSTVFKPQIILSWNKQYKDESTQFEYGRNNIFGIINYDPDTLELLSISSISAVTLSAYTSSALTAMTLISTSSNLDFVTVKKGYHTFQYNIPNSLSSSFSPFLTIIYTDGTTKTITKNLTQTLLLTQAEKDEIVNGTAKIAFKTNFEEEIDLTTVDDFIQFNIQCFYYDTNNAQLGFIFDHDKKVIKNVSYKVYDEYGKIIQDLEQAHYNDTLNFIWLHKSLLESGRQYFLDLKINSLYYVKEMIFKTL